MPVRRHPNQNHLYPKHPNLRFENKNTAYGFAMQANELNFAETYRGSNWTAKIFPENISATADRVKIIPRGSSLPQLRLIGTGFATVLMVVTT